MIKRVLVLGILTFGATARAESVSTMPVEVYKTVKGTLAKITISGKVLQSCPTPIPSNRLFVELYYVPTDAALKDRAAKEPVTRFDLDGGAFSGIRELPEGSYRIKAINMRDNKVVADQKLIVTSKDVNVDLLVSCDEEPKQP